nr:G protein-coupled receptor [Proales similis]
MESNDSNLTWSVDELQQLIVLNQVNFYVNDLLGSFIFVFGVLFNTLSFIYFQLSKSFRDTSMRHYFSVLSISDTLRLSEWLFALLIDKQLISLNQTLCRLLLFLTITSGHISVWLLVFLSIERYVILQFPFRGKQFYTVKNSLRLLCVIIVALVVLDLPYLFPDFVQSQFVNAELHLYMCITNPQYRSFMFVNNVLFFSIIPFCLLLVFNCLLIGLLARQHLSFLNMTQSDALATSNKRERQFKERTVLLMLVTFFLVLTVSPRYITQMILMLIGYQSLFKVTLAKCLNVLEMLNFSFNFLFYIICSQTSRTEFYLIMYYLFYWRWSKQARAAVICNHLAHNPVMLNAGRLTVGTSGSVRQSTSAANSSPQLPAQTAQIICEPDSHVCSSSAQMYSVDRSDSRPRIHCFIQNARRTRSMRKRSFKSETAASANGDRHRASEPLVQS